MKSRSAGVLLFWAARELSRHPARPAVLGLSLFLLTLTAATPLVLNQALRDTVTRILDRVPAVVVQRVSPLGWTPLPAQEAVRAALSVPGVVSAAPRIWGEVGGPDRAMTVVGVTDEVKAQLEALVPDLPPPVGRCILAPEDRPTGATTLTLRNGRQVLDAEPVDRPDTGQDRLPPGAVLVNEADARRLLEIPPGFAADLAIDVYHDTEQTAILEDLENAFPWPVRMTTRTGVKDRYANALARNGGRWSIMLVPAILAMLLVAASGVDSTAGAAREVGLLRALGWTARDVVTLNLLKGLLVALPAVSLGLSAACLLVFWPGIRWPERLWSEWSMPAGALYADVFGIGLTLLQVAALALCPYLAAVVWPSARKATADPLEVMRAGE